MLRTNEHTISVINDVNSDEEIAKRFYSPNAVYPISTWRAIPLRTLLTEALPQALLDSCHRPVQIRGVVKGPRRKVSLGQVEAMRNPGRMPNDEG